ncbi:MAG: hypothetical protein LBM19_04205 [Holosporales bacterium]|nr:hypothetical protein [Holosporales bacterium]
MSKRTDFSFLYSSIQDSVSETVWVFLFADDKTDTKFYNKNYLKLTKNQNKSSTPNRCKTKEASPCR